MVWNIKNKTQRFLTLTPTTSWGSKGLIGVTIRMDDYATAEENLLRVLSVEKNSPAALAGLTPNTDYLLGTTMDSFENEGVLADVLEENEESVVEIYVYNTDSDVVRVVTLVPSTKWGGRGLLGAEIGRGYLHRLPKGCKNTLGVSFERKVLVDDHDATSCGAVDLKLNETVKNESSVPEESSSNEAAGVDDTKHGEMAADEKKVDENVRLSTTDGGAQKEDEKIDKELLEEVANSSLDDITTKETAGECTNETSESIAMSTTTNEKEEDKPVEVALPTELHNDDDEELTPISTISKFPPIQTLHDSSLINAVEPSSEVLDELPPPPTPLSIEPDTNAVDLR